MGPPLEGIAQDLGELICNIEMLKSEKDLDQRAISLIITKIEEAQLWLLYAAGVSSYTDISRSFMSKEEAIEAINKTTKKLLVMPHIAL